MSDAGPDGPHLVLDGASDEVTVAVVEVTGAAVSVRAERRWRVTATVARELAGGVTAVLAEAALDPAALVAVVVNAGPGRYGGVRAAVATAQGIAVARDLPVAAVHRLEAVALPALAPGGPPVVAVHDTGRGRIGWAAYADAGPGAPPAVVVAPRVDPLEAAVAAAPRGAAWRGEIAAALATHIAAADPGAAIAPVADRGAARRAQDLVALARAHRAYAGAEAVDAVYLRPPSITRPAGQEHGTQ